MKHEKSIMVSFYLFGDNLAPEDISAMLGVEPTDAWRMGAEKVLKKSGNKVVRKTGLWKFRTQTKSDKLDDHLSELVAVLSRRSIENISAFPGVETAKVDVFIQDQLDLGRSEGCIFDISSENAVAIGLLGLKIEFTVRIDDDRLNRSPTVSNAP